MKKFYGILLCLVFVFVLTGCNNNEGSNSEGKKGGSNLKWNLEEKTFFDSLPAPSKTIDNSYKDEKDKNHSEYTIYVKKYSYNDYRKYVNELENDGFHYQFYDVAVPEKESDLTDKTETLWTANNGKIWIRAMWRDDSNLYFNGYNLQVIYNNYDYTLPITK